MSFLTEQEAFWVGQFGTDYARRNRGAKLLASNIAFFSRCLAQTRTLESCIEFGANIGMNLQALKLLYPEQEQHAIEINPDAARELAAVVPPGNIHATSILDFEPPRTYDLCLIKGVLIHINPDHLPDVYDKLHAAAGRYLLMCEYYNPAPVAIPYRGHQDKLFKRDFCGEMLDRHNDLRLVDYGFAYRRDPRFPQDDVTWFLLSKEP